MRWVGVAALAALWLAPATAPAQEQAAGRGLPGALLALELALEARPPAPGDVAEINREFDRASLAFFAGRTEVVLDALERLLLRVEPDSAARGRHRTRADSIVIGLDARRRVLEGAGAPVPWRLHLPPDREAEPLPVIVTLHGAGGNEHMFLEAYGAGRIRDLADSLGFVVISPATPALARSPEALEGLLEAAAAEHPLDLGRVYLLGHSMGAGVAWSLAERFPGRVAAVACISGTCGGASSATEGTDPAALPPLLMLAAELDPLAAPERVEAAATRARARGVRVEYRVAPSQGHTLVVGSVLGEVVAWLLGQGAGPRGGQERPGPT